jgi:hypothetical protein
MARLTLKAVTLPLMALVPSAVIAAASSSATYRFVMPRD